MNNILEKLFSYGTLQLPEVQMQTFGRLLDGKKDAIFGYKIDMLKITNPDVIKLSGKAEHPVLTLTQNPKDEVLGTVLELTTSELDQADLYEASDYKRININMKSGDRAWVYVKN